MTKQYRLINAQHLCTRVQVAGRSVTVKFSGGRKDSGGVLRDCGAFVTDDEKLQLAIQSDSGYDKVFKLYGDYPPQDGEGSEDAPTAETPSQDGEGSEGAPNAETLPQGFEEVSGITNTNTAKEWLEVNRGVQLGTSAKKAEVKAAAHNAGVKFVDWL